MCREIPFFDMTTDTMMGDCSLENLRKTNTTNFANFSTESLKVKKEKSEILLTSKPDPKAADRRRGILQPLAFNSEHDPEGKWTLRHRHSSVKNNVRFPIFHQKIL